VDNRGVDGPRACSPHELPALITAANLVFRPSGGDMGRDYPLLFSVTESANLRVISDAGDIVAHAGLCVRPASLRGVTVPVGALGAVFTRADHRGRGLGAGVVADALARARAAGVALALVSGDGPLYQRLGFAPVPPATAWSPPAPSAPPDVGVGGSPGVKIAVRPAGVQDAPLLARLYDAEPVRFVRSVTDWHALLQALVLFAWPADLWIVESGGRPAGYLAVPRRATRRVLELAGDRPALLAAAPLVAEQVVVPWHDDETAAGARAAGWHPASFALAMGSQWLVTPPAPLPLPWYGLNYV
jgi:GNAT superfamily N-acetyltransferase